jgi:predicted lipoprotein with Yx(FWY)xxD motif
MLQTRRTKKMGTVVTDENGYVLYRSDRDIAYPPKSNCYGACARLWTPVLADEQQITGIDASKVGTARRTDGSRQVTLGGWSLYYYKGDRKPGDWFGQNQSRTWFAVSPSGTKNLTCVPAKPPAPPAVTDDAPAVGGY